MEGAVPTVLAAAIVLTLAARLRPTASTRRPSAGGQRPAATGRRARPASRRRRVADIDELLDLLDEIGRAVRTGSSLTTAIERGLQGRAGVLDGVGAALASGRSLPLALSAAERGGPDATLALHALTIAARTGGPSVAALERAAAVLRERRAWRAERVAQAAQARLGASIMTVVPIGFAVWSALGSERVRATYDSAPVAMPLAAVGCCLNAAGWWWMRRITAGGMS